ncbi:MAG: orotidine 5'-phosphate decarboxylase [Bacteroidetes bacterium GWF2_40_14]|nr:MAG: orotidine 5'-phosphate decarboxylase [Bacteroidetes bacterium GWF2_40_14]
MNYDELYSNIVRKGSFLCVGLDSDPELFPEHISALANPIFEFNKAIIDATAQYSVAYKPNLAFYEACGVAGWMQLAMTVEYIRKTDPSIFIIADAKRGDIGNTAKLYAKAFFEKMDFDAITLAPYMGRDSVDPFLTCKNKWAIILALTSNPSAEDFELEKLESGQPLFRKVMEESMTWGTKENTMFVVGATRPEKLAEIREYCPDHFFLVPGVGTQGGSIAEVAANGMNRHCGLLVNVSRAIIFADRSDKFAIVAAEKAREMATEMAVLLKTLL